MEKQGKSRKPLLVGVIAAVVVLAALLALLLTQCFGGQPNDTTPSTTEGVTTTAPVTEEYKLYWNVDRNDHVVVGEHDDIGVTARKVQEDGYYHVIFACDGEQIDLPIIDRRLLTKIDSTDLMSLVFDENGVVIDAILIDDLPVEVLGANWYIQSMGGNAVKINSSSDLDGMEELFKTNENTKIYDMSGMSDFIGAPTFLQKEDCITTILNEEGDVTHIFVVGREGIKKYKTAYCEHCKAEVEWENWYLTSSAPTKDGHFYLERDIEMSGSAQVKESAKLCLDLNGHTITGRSGYRVYSTYNAAAELAIMDTSEAKTGTIKSRGEKMDQGTVLWARYGVISIYGGTFDASAATSKQDGTTICAEGGTVLNMYGGKVIGGTAVLREDKQQGQGGAVCVRATATASATFNMYGGEIVGGKAQNQGGNVYLYGARATFNMYGGTIRGGTSLTSMGGNIFATGKVTINMSGGTITGGTATEAGNVALNAGTTLNMTGGTITNGKVKDSSGVYNDAAVNRNLLVQNSYLKMYGGNIAGYVNTYDSNTKDEYNTSVYVASSAKITGAAEGHNNLALGNNVVFTVGKLNKNAAIGITVAKAGTFSSNAVSESVLANLTSDLARYTFGLDEESKLTTVYDAEANVKVHCICGDPNGTGTPCAEGGHEQHKWYIWTDSSASPFLDGFWYLDKDLDLSGSNHNYYGDKASTTDKVDPFKTATGIIGRVDYAELDTESVIKDGEVNVYVDLNGYNITGRSGHRVWRVDTTNNLKRSLTITDTSADKAGKVIAGAQKGSDQGMIIWADNTVTTVNIYGGTLDASKITVAENRVGGAAIQGKSPVNLYGGKIIGGTALGNNGDAVNAGMITLHNGASIVSGGGSSGSVYLQSGEYITLDDSWTVQSEPLTIRIANGFLGAVVKGELTAEEAKTFSVINAVPPYAVVHRADGLYVETMEEDPNHRSHCYCGKTTTTGTLCASCGQEAVIWAAWTDAKSLPTSGHFYLDTDVTIAGTIWYDGTKGYDLKLDLHGHTVTMNSNFYVYNNDGKGVHLVITDCVGTGKIVTTNDYSSGKPGGIIRADTTATIDIYGGTLDASASKNTTGGVLYLINSATVNMYGGKIIGGSATSGGAVYIGGTVHKGGTKNTFNLFDGTITGGTATANGGGNIHVNGGSFTMTGGTVTGGTSVGNHGGNIYVTNGATVSITGGIVSDGVVKPAEGATSKGDLDKNGGNISISGATTKVTIGGNAQITGGEADRGGNIFHHTGILTIEGTAQVTGGKANNLGYGGGCGNVHVNDTVKGTSDTGKVILSGTPTVTEIKLVSAMRMDVTGLEKDAKIGITAAVGPFTTIAKDATVAEAFTSTNPDYKAVATTINTIALVSKDTTDPVEDTYNTEPEDPEDPEKSNIYCYCGKTTTLDAVCDDCGSKAVEWTAWTDATALPKSGHYYLTVDVNMGYQGGVTDSLALDLNGHTVTQTKTETRMFYIYGTSQLTITDCSEEGNGTLKSCADYAFEGNSRGAIIRADANSVVNIYGGILDASETTVGVRGAAIDANNNAAVYLYDGTIKGGNAPIGGAVYLGESSSLTMVGGTIEGGSTTNGGAIYMKKGTLNVSGGSIIGGTATESGSCVYTASAECTVKLSGTPKITEIMLGSDQRIDITGLKKDADIGIALAGGKGIFTNAAQDATVAEAFHSTNNAYEVVATAENTMELVDNTSGPGEGGDPVAVIHCYCGKTTTLDAVCESCGSKAVEWTAWTETGSLPTSGNYYLTANVDLEASVTVNGTSLALDLNGYTVTQTAKTRMFKLVNSGSLTVADTSETGNGSLVFAQDLTSIAENWGGIVHVSSGSATLNIYGGTLDASGGKSGYGTAIRIESGTTVNMYGGTVKGGEASGSGGCALSVSGTFNMTGGTVHGANSSGGAGGAMRTGSGGGTINLSGNAVVTGGTSQFGDTIFFAAGTLTISENAKVAGKIYARGTTFTVSDSVQISDAELVNNAKIAIGETGLVTSGENKASIGVTMANAGVITKAAVAEEQLSCFYSNKSGYKVAADGETGCAALVAEN